MTIAKTLSKSAILIMLANFVSAEEKHCSLIEDHRDRLNCHTKYSTPNDKNWLVATSKYNKSSSISRSAKYPVMCADKVGSNSIILTCADTKMEVLLSTSCVMGNSNDKSIVLVQVDDQESKAVIFTIPNNKYSLILRDNNSAVELATSILGNQQMHMRVSPPSGEPYTVTFDISDLMSKVAPIRESCDW